MLSLALYQPDIAPNVGAAMRLCAGLDVTLEIIQPCGFVWDKARIRRAALDYIDQVRLIEHASWQNFWDENKEKRRIVLLTTKAAAPYTDFLFRPDDIILAGRESAGVPEEVHDAANARLVIPLRAAVRSLNIVTAAAMVLGEAKRQIR